MMDLRTRVQHILAGRFDRAGLPPPRMCLSDHEELARVTIRRAGRPRIFADPRHIAVGNGLRLLARCPSGICREATANGILAYRWDPDPQLLGTNVMHGVAHGVLHTECGATNESDAWILTGCLFVLREHLSLAAERMDLATAHTFPWLIMSRLIQANIAMPASF